MKNQEENFDRLNYEQISFKEAFYNAQKDNSYEPLQQNYFAQELFQITPRYIPTSYGRVYSITAGCPGQPLILVVHGSGPKNSSQQYIYLLHQYLVRISYIQKFYIVAIDCPGYGKSIGSKEAIKTFPKQLFQEILSGLGYKKYFAMLGHSQGGAAIFNAVYEKPSLSQLLVMDRPVCGNIQRFRKFNIPTLLIYDIQDDGHPIWQGKLLYKQLAYSDFFTYRNSQDTYWVPDNIWNKMLDFFSKYSANRKGRQNVFFNFRAVSMSPSVKHVSKQLPSHKLIDKKLDNQKLKEKNIEQKPKKRKAQNSESFSRQKQRKTHSLSSHKPSSLINQQRIPEQKFNLHELEQVQEMQMEKQDLLSVYSSSLSDAQRQKIQQIQAEMKQKQKQLLKDEKPIVLGQTGYQINQKVVIQGIKESNSQSSKKNNLSQHQIAGKKENQMQEKKQDQNENRCSICLTTFYRPLQTNCNHIFCTKCLLQSLLVKPNCPLCRGIITKKIEKKQLHQKILMNMPKQEVNKREKAYLKLKLMLDSVVMIEIGNRCVELETKKSHFAKTKKKYMWELFANEKNTFKFDEVAFDINMGDPYSKPVRVRNGPFVFESRGTFSFSCEITIRPRNKQYAAITTVYRINLEPGVHKQVIAFKKKIYLKQ